MRLRLWIATFLSFTIAITVAFALFSGSARASAAWESPYTSDQTFGTAVRLVRVDLGFKITEKDSDGGYVLFEYTSPESGKRVSSGSIEVVKTKAGAHVTVQLPAMPSYHEAMILEALEKKLAAEQGAAPTHPKPSPAPVVDDAGAAATPDGG